MKQAHVCAAMTRVLTAAMIVITLASGAWSQTEKIIHTFTGGVDGFLPQAGLVFDGKGNLYGTTSGGGSDNPEICSCGTVFELSPGTNSTWSKSLVYTFAGANGDGISPYGGLTFDTQGNLYGTTEAGGQFGLGTVFELVAGSNGTWTETILYSFKGGVGDGEEPLGPAVIFDGAGNLYGTTPFGGAKGWGTVFELVAGPNGTWTEKILHSFTGGNDGAQPWDSQLIFDSAGHLYGTTEGGGANDYGTVFELTRTSSSGAWTEKVIYSFTSAVGGSSPIGSLLFDGTGNLYGVATFIVFELTPGDAGWTEKTLHTFAGGKDGAYPFAGLTWGKAGNLYGTTRTGGDHHGTVFELTPGPNGTWTETVLHSFGESARDGTSPYYGALVLDAAGNLYGTTLGGGSSNYGVVFEVKP
jgi:uncharacterized repeat protein (TIGR03803 family)